MTHRSLVLILLLVSPLAIGDEPPEPWCVTLGEARPESERGRGFGWTFGSSAGPHLTAVDARYEVDLFGPVARGRLIVSFVNPDDNPRRVAVFSEPSGSLLHGGARIDAYGDGERAIAVSRGLPSNRTVAAGAKRRVVQDPPSEPTAIDLEPAQRLEIGAEFTGRAEFVDGTYRLELPPVVSACYPGLGTQARRAPLAVPTTALWRVFDEGRDIVIDSSTHSVFANYQGDHTRVELAAANTDLQRPLRLDYSLAELDEPSLDAFTATGADGASELVLVLSPPAELPHADELRAKEVLFVIDTSGSMRGQKIVSVRDALVTLLDRLADDDRFNVVEFDSEHTMLYDRPVEVRGYGRSSAESWVRALEADGSTLLLPALAAAVDQAESDDHHRMVIVLTDGRLGDTEAVERFLAEHVDCERLFFVGTGEQDRERIEYLAQISRGIALFADEPGQLAATLERLFDQVSAPYAWDLEIDGAYEVKPSPLPDLYAGRPVTLRMKIDGELPDTITVSGMTVDGPQSFTLEVAGRDFPAMPALAGPEPRKSAKTTVSRNVR